MNPASLRLIPAVPILLAAVACAGPTPEPSRVSDDPAEWPGPVTAEARLRFGSDGNATATHAEPLSPAGDALALEVAEAGRRAGYAARTDLTLPADAGMELGPDQYVRFEIRVEGDQDPRVLLQLDEPRDDTNLRGLVVLPPVPADGSWHELDVNLLRNELSGDRRPRSTIMPDGTSLTRLGILIDPRAGSGLTRVELRDIRFYRQDKLAHAPVTASDAAGQTALHRAAMVGDAEKARRLLARGADVNAKNAYLYTPLAHAVIAHDPETVAVLIEHGADVSAERRLGFTPLYDAAADGQLEIMRLLLDAGADPTQKTEYGFEPLFTAAHHGHVEASELLLADPRVDVNRPIAGFMPLHVAAQGEEAGPHRDLYERLIELGAEADLCSAAAAGDDERIAAMLAADPDAAKTTTILEGWTPLHDAVRNAHPSTVALLLEHGADPNAVSGDIDFKSVPLHWIGNAYLIDDPARKLEVLRRMVAAGADLDVLDKGGSTPLDRAMQIGDRALVDALREFGARTGAERKAASESSSDGG